MKRFLRYICKVTGHWFTFTDMWIFGIKTNDLNRDYSAILRCRLCHTEFVHKNAKEE